jgi:phospholipid-transporting ATPase
LYSHTCKIVPADSIILKTSIPGGVCYVETAQLDGETNLKLFNAPTDISKGEEPAYQLNAKIQTQVPDNDLYKFFGKVIWNPDTPLEKTISLNSKHILLRVMPFSNLSHYSHLH